MKTRYLNIERWAHWLLIQEKTNQLSHMIMMLLGQIELGLSDCANSEFHARTLYRSQCRLCQSSLHKSNLHHFLFDSYNGGKDIFRKCHLKLLLSKYVIIFMQVLCHSFPHWSTCGQYELLFFMMITVLFSVVVSNEVQLLRYCT